MFAAPRPWFVAMTKSLLRLGRAASALVPAVALMSVLPCRICSCTKALKYAMEKWHCCCQQHGRLVMCTAPGFLLCLCVLSAARLSDVSMALTFLYRKDHAEQLGNGSGVSLAPRIALANAETAAGAQHCEWHAGVQVLAQWLGHRAAESRGKNSPSSRVQSSSQDLPDVEPSIVWIEWMFPVPVQSKNHTEVNGKACMNSSSPEVFSSLLK